NSAPYTTPSSTRPGRYSCVPTALELVRLLVEEVVGAVVLQRLLPRIRLRGAGAGIRRDASVGIQALDEGHLGQLVAACRHDLGSSLGQEQPRDRVIRDEFRVGGGLKRGRGGVPPYGARVAGALPRRTLLAALVGVGTVEVGDDLVVVAVDDIEQGCLWPDERPGEA